MPTESRISERKRDLALELRVVEELGDGVDLPAAGRLLVVGDDGGDAGPRIGVGAPRVPVGGAELGREVRVGVRAGWRVELLRPAEPDDAGGQPVGDEMRSRPVSWPAASCGLIFPKNSTLSLMSSVYLTLMPVRRVKASRVGRLFSSSPTSMYSVQLEKLIRFSFAEWSSDAPRRRPAPLRGRDAAGAQRARGRRAARARRARRPAAGERRVRAPLPSWRLRRIAASWGAERRSGSYCSMRVVPFRVGGPPGGGRCDRSPKTVRCQSFRATAVLSYMTCLTCVYSSKE